MLPFRSQTMAQNRARVREALAPLFHVEDAERGGPMPGECPECVFDFTDGMRIVLSRECMPDGKILLHGSASAKPKSQCLSNWKGCLSAAQAARIVRSFLDRVRGRLMEMTGKRFELAGFSEDKNVPHFFCEE